MFRRGAGTFLFDPPEIPDFSPLEEAIHAEEWVLHAASQDLACLREVGLDPDRIFDTELAARLLGMPRVGLASVVEELLGIKLAKEHSAADWSTRPLPQAWLKYAALDVELLVDVRDRLVERLAETGKADLAAQEFEAVLHKEAKPPAAEPWRRLSGIHAMRSPRNLAVARELWLARDARASELDIAPGRMVPDSSILVAAKALPQTRRALADLREFTGRASRSELDRWWSAIERGLATDQLPAVRVPTRLAAAAPGLVDAQPRGRRAAAARAGGHRRGRRAGRHARREPAHARPPASGRLESAGRAHRGCRRIRARGARRAPVAGCGNRTDNRGCLCRGGTIGSGCRDGRFVGSVNRFSALGSRS